MISAANDASDAAGEEVDAEHRAEPVRVERHEQVERGEGHRERQEQQHRRRCAPASAR